MSEDDTRAANEMRALINDVLAIKGRIDAEWAVGLRDGPRMALYGVCDAALAAWAAIEADDPAAFKAAIEKVRSGAFSATFHAANWLKAKT